MSLSRTASCASENDVPTAALERVLNGPYDPILSLFIRENEGRAVTVVYGFGLEAI